MIEVNIFLKYIWYILILIAIKFHFYSQVVGILNLREPRKNKYNKYSVTYGIWDNTSNVNMTAFKEDWLQTKISPSFL